MGARSPSLDWTLVDCGFDAGLFCDISVLFGRSVAHVFLIWLRVVGIGKQKSTDQFFAVIA